MEQKSKLKRFLSLLKGAQNTAFVGLVCENIKVELQQKPWKAMKVLDFLMTDVPRQNSDFTRLKLAEGLIPLLSELTSEQTFDQMLSYAHSNEKWRKKLLNSHLVIDLSTSKESERAFFSFSEMLSRTKASSPTQFFMDLLENYQPLLAENILSASSSAMSDVSKTGAQKSSSKEGLKQIFMESAFVGGAAGRGMSDKLKLSDFIDEEFFDELDSDSDTEMASGQKKQLLSQSGLLKDLQKELKKNQDNQVFMPQVQKRVKGAQEQDRSAYIIMHPVLALLMQIHIKESLLDNDWKIRQSSFNLIKVIYEHFNQKCLEYALITEKLVVNTKNTVIQKEISKALLPQTFLVLLQDHFNDFEELKVLTPVREIALELFVCLITKKDLLEDSTALLQQLPNLLKAIETSSQENWITRYNLFMMIKGFFKHDQLKQQVFNMFNRVLMESLVHLEDEVRIIVTEIITMILPLHIEQPQYLANLSHLLKNLMKNLKKSDEIESSAISVFSLINKILDSLPDSQQKGFQFKFEIKTICPFNFHKIGNVRYSYLQILNKTLKFGLDFPLEDLQILMKLTLQSLAMERTKSIVKLNLENLQLLGIRLSYNEEVFVNFINAGFTYDMILPTLLYNYQMTTFDNFLFYESKNFESVERDYFKIVFRPVNQEEIALFYQGKVKNMTKALASMMISGGPNVAAEIFRHMEAYMLPPQTLDPSMAPPVNENHLLYLLTLSRVLLENKLDIVNTEYIGGIAQSFMQTQNFNEESIGIFHFRDIQRLQQISARLYELVSAQKQDSQMQPLSLMLQYLDACYYQQRLVDLPVFMHHLEQVLIPLFTEQSIPDTIQDCFNEFRMLMSQMTEYANITCLRIRQLAALVHICLAEHQKTVLTPQLNNLIKPILTQVKKESNSNMQSLAAKACVKLLNVMKKQGKIKPVQQILQVLIKDMELSEFDQPSEGEIGVRKVLKNIIKTEQEIFSSYQGYFQGYLSQQITQDSFLSLSRVGRFILESIQSNQRELAATIYSEQIPLFGSLISNLLQNNFKSPSITQLGLLFYRMFPQLRASLLTAILQGMTEKKNSVAFETLMKLLDDFQSGGIPDFVTYLPAFVIPIIQSIQISRQIFDGDDKQVTLILAQLLSLLPLNLASMKNKQIEESKTSTSPQLESQLTGDLLAQTQQGFNFLQLFVNNHSDTHYQLSINVKANLRDYQLQGITWLASLGKYNLNCALCDDMGLGKTLQSLCVVLNESYLRNMQTGGHALSATGKGKLSSKGIAVNKHGQNVINMIVCPTSITYNWKVEIDKYFDGIRVIVYEGSTQERKTMIEGIQKGLYDVVITSYEKLRNDIEQFTQINFFYVILDEAHLIKNAKAKTTKAVKTLKCEKKLVLTGTPLQNKVSELWSIFDFLMPGFLEEENVFNKKYNQYLTSNIKKLSEKLEETQYFINALKSLKKRIQPFILRRTKDQVLKELPPKIIQDVVCKMTTFQEHVHSLLEKHHPITQTIQQAQQPKEGATSKAGGKQILQNLIMHRKVCNHPMFVARDFAAKDKSVANYFGKKTEQELLTYENSGKLLGLVDKLIECEIIQNADGKETESQKTTDESLFADLASAATHATTQRPHRALIFCQMSSFLRMIIDQILVKFNVHYLELSSTHSAKERVDIVEQFNSDESIRVLILTTAVGGLGLTLTGADTVIFAEHDWNPMRDLQAIDRAHRIGQTRQVCVYRLIVQDTLEEKIMNLQRFKENLARSLMQSKDTSVENANNMELTDLLNSFQEHSAFKDEGKPKPKGGAGAVNGFEDKILSGIEEIWKGGAFSVEDL